MLLTYHKIERLNYQLVHVINALKCKLKKGQEPSKKQCVTGISGTLDYTAPFTSVIINSYNRILGKIQSFRQTSDKDYNSRSDVPSLIFPTSKLRNKPLNPFRSLHSLHFSNMTNSNTCPFSGNNLDNEENIFVWTRFVSKEGRDEVIAFLRDDLELDMDGVSTDSNDFEMTLAENANYELEDVLRENGWIEQGDEDDKEITAKDIDNLSPEAKALYDRLKG